LELKAEQKIQASREQVFAALNDPEILRQCIPGCESLEKTSETEMLASVTLKVGPVKARFKGGVELSNLVPPESYTITGEGKGGAAGFAKGGADVTLLADGSGTLLRYQVKADVAARLPSWAVGCWTRRQRSCPQIFSSNSVKLLKPGPLRTRMRRFRKRPPLSHPWHRIL